MTKNPDEKLGAEIVTEWYDGPLRSIRAVEFADGHRLIQVVTVLATVSESFTIGYDENARDVMIRFDREELLKMLAAIDGKPIEDYRGDLRISVTEDA